MRRANHLQKTSSSTQNHGGSLIQPKLSINQPGDKYEQEADTMADRVMRMEKSGPIHHAPLPIQRKCAACEQEEKVMPKAQGGETVASERFSRQLQTANGSGRPLSPETQMDMGRSFGTDFGSVRIHTGSQAAEMNQQIQAKAFTHGSHIYFNQGQYNPQSSQGKRLLAHELTHVVQQGGGNQHIQRDFDGDRAAEGAGWGALGGGALGAIIGGVAGSETGFGGGWGALLGAGIGVGVGALVGLLGGGFSGASAYSMDCTTTPMMDFPVTFYYGRRRDAATRRKVNQEISQARSVLRNCCLNLVVFHETGVVPGVANFPSGTNRADGSWDYPNQATTLGTGPTFSGSRGLPVLVVDSVPGSGGGVTVSSQADPQYAGRLYAVLGVNHPNANASCNHLAHELWHVAGNFNHDPAQGGPIAACTSNIVNERFCLDLRRYAATIQLPPPVPSSAPGDYPLPSRETAVV
ncbi:MAG: DUF4157 domain-containing protein [Bacteroidota bacterium]